MKTQDTKEEVKKAYGKVARGCQGGSCCSPRSDTRGHAHAIGYTEEELNSAPGGANLGLGCGNPVSRAALHEGETVLDLGSGAGLDCFLAAAQVGPRGRVIGVDMTPEMIARAQAQARENGITNVEFRPGDIEDLPVDDGSVDIIISNCVINLAADKRKAYAEAYRVLKPGGRIAISDMALTAELPDDIRKSIQAWVGCISGALQLHEYKGLLEEAGFRDVTVSSRPATACTGGGSPDPIARSVVERFGDNASFLDSIVSVHVEGYK